MTGEAHHTWVNSETDCTELANDSAAHLLAQYPTGYTVDIR